MGSERSGRKKARFGAALTAAIVVGMGCSDYVGGDPGGDGPPREIAARPAAAFFGATTTITLKSPHRCEHLDADAGAPVFQWVLSDQSRVVVAVMRERPAVEGREITNKQDIVWVWTTAGDRSDGGWLAWSDGFTPDPETGLPAGAPPLHTELGEEVGLYWLVTWAFDDDRVLSYSSELRPFFLGPMSAGQTALASKDACCRRDLIDEDWIEYWCRPPVDIEEEPAARTHETAYGCMDYISLCAE